MSGDLQTADAMSVPIYVVDAFSDKPFFGNSAAVCLLSPEMVLTDKQMQQIGGEMNLSETAFVKLEKGDFQNGSTFGLRWFTPTHEVDLCGHATLASSAVLFHMKGNRNDEITFNSKSGPLRVRRGEGKKISLNFPMNSPTPVNPSEMKQLLEVCVEDQALIEDVQLSKTGKLLIRLKDNVDRKTFEQLKPKINMMIESDPSRKVKGVGLTVKGSKENGCVDSEGNVYDFISRYFSPWFGIPEDPVTGAWHTVATPYWAGKLKKSKLYARQCSARGGDLWLSVGDDDDDRVTITGAAVVNLQGRFSLPN